MNKNLLIIGAGMYGLVAKEIAESMGCFERIAFVDDDMKTTLNGMEVIGTTKDLGKLADHYNNVIVAVGNPDFRMKMLGVIEKETRLNVVNLVSPRAYVSPSAQIGKGSIIEPMAVVHTACVLMKGCIVSAGAVINHASVCGEGVHVDCNATVAGYTFVPNGSKVNSGEVFRNSEVVVEDLFHGAVKDTE